MSLLGRVSEYILKHSMLPPNGRIIVAVSGGGDSIALLDILGAILGESQRSRIVVGHLEHGLRPSAKDEAKFVKELAQNLGYECRIAHTDVRARSESENRSIEEAARCARYEFLLSVAREFESTTVVTGHHSDDQAETLLLNLFRGSGLVGLGGMHPVRVFGDDTDITLVRPLLCVSRQELSDYIKERGLKFCTDESNYDNRFRRNLIRNKIMPNIKELIQPRLSETLNRTAKLAREAAMLIEELSRDIFPANKRNEPFELPLNILRTTKTSLLAPAIKAAYKRATGRSLDFTHIEKILELQKSEAGKSIDLPGAWTATKRSSSIRIAPPAEDPPDEAAPWHIRLKIGAQEVLPSARTICATIKTFPEGAKIPKPIITGADFNAGVEQWLDYDAVGAPDELTVRSRRSGDTFTPLGAPGTKSLKEFMINSRVPTEERSSMPIVTTTDNKIIWVAPIRIAEEGRITSGTKKILVLKLSAKKKPK